MSKSCSSNNNISLKDKFEKSDEQIFTPTTLNDIQTSNDNDDKNKEEEKKSKIEVIEDPNELGAKLIKAELMGDEELVESLKKRLEVARAAHDSKSKQAQTTTSTNNNANNKHHNHHKQNRDHKKKGKGGEGKSREYSDDEKEFQIKKQKINESKSEPVENCVNCFENAQKHLIASIGKYCYLALPSTKSLVSGHCYISPINHCSSSVTCDEEVWSEIQEFRRALVKMFDSKRMDCVFFEQYSLNKKYSHLIIECIPLDMSVSTMAPIYFKKAIQEAESEWCENKSIIDLKKQNIRKSIPRNMPYFNVNFGLEDGYAHIIEKIEAFDDCFAKEVIGGILDLDPMDWRRPARDQFNVQSAKVIEFNKWWKSYDFNKK